MTLNIHTCRLPQILQVRKEDKKCIYHLTRKTRSFIHTCNYWGWSRGRGQSKCGVGPVSFNFWHKLRGEGVQTSCFLHLAFLAPVSFGFLLLSLFLKYNDFVTSASYVLCPWYKKIPSRGMQRMIDQFEDFLAEFLCRDFCDRCLI